MAEARSTQVGSRGSVPSSDGGATSSRLGKLSIRVLLGILGLAVVVKLAVFGLTIGTSMNLSIPNAENWQDFMLAYVPAVDAFKSGLLPYRDFFYPYPPLFLWVLTAFSPFAYPPWTTGLPLALSDALTVIPVYLVAREFGSERTSRLVAVLFIFAPTNLYYADYLLLNPPLTTLFLMSAVYLLIRRRYGWSALSLALAIGLKQTALFALPVVLIITLRQSGGKAELLKYLLLVAAACAAFSLPYLAASPGLYLSSILRLPLGTFGWLSSSNYFQLVAGNGTQVTFDTSDWVTSRWALLSAGVYSPATLALPFFIFLVPRTLFSLYTSSLLSYAMWLLLLAGYVLVLRNAWRRKRIDLKDSLNLVVWSMLAVFTFYPFYKYYVVGIIPFLLLMVRDRRDALGFVAFSIVFMLVPRYFGSWMMLGALAWVARWSLRREV